MDIYIGGVIEVESERLALKKIAQLLDTDGKRAVIFANFYVMSRQIDLLVATNDIALVIEVKGFSRPIRGGENGYWQYQQASGQWKDFRNPYQQALKAALEVKNAVANSNFVSNKMPYIDSVLIFSPTISHGSNVFEGNNKVSVIRLDGLQTELRKRRSGALSVNVWKRFADHLGLKQVSSIDAACDLKLDESDNRLRQYKEKFCRAYREGTALVPFSCRLDGKTISSDEVTQLICERGGGLILKGPSGCGKSMLAEAASVAYSESGGTPIIVQGKEFSGRIKEVINREATLLGAQSATQLLQDAQRLKRPVLLIADGYNECPEKLRGQFTRGVVALADRYGTGLLVTSQIQPERNELLGLVDVNVQTPTKEIKFAIAEGVSDSKEGLAAIKDLLDAVSTGLEAKLVGEVGADVTPAGSRYTLFDAFARKRLSEAASDGIRALSKVADWLSTRFAFSLSIRDFDRLMDEDSVSSELRKLLVDSGMLTVKGDRVSFPHEMFLDAFATEAVVRQAGDDPDLVLKAIKSPLHAARKSLIIGAIEDSLMLDSLLPRLEDDASIRACLQGECGNHAQEWSEGHYRKLLGLLREEAANVCFEVKAEVVRKHFVDIKVGFAHSSLKEWTACDRAFIVLLPALIAETQYLDEAMDIVRIMDNRIEEESLRLCRETRIKKTVLQSRLFATSYVVSQHFTKATTGIAKTCDDITSGVFTTRIRGGITEQSDEPGDMSVWLELMGQALSPGQLYLFLKLCRYRDIIPTSFIRREIESRWNTAPYHLRLALVDSVLPVHAAGGDAERVKLIKVIEELENNDPFLSSSIIEALQKLGALDKDADEHQTTVLENIRNCLSRPEDSQYQTEAWRIYKSQFEHPYDTAYCEAVASLSISEQKALLDMALRVAEVDFWLGPLLLKLASFGDPGAGENIGRWTKPPSTDSFMPQLDIEAFVIAHVALAKLRCPLPKHQYSDEAPSERALMACGTILYWSNREDIGKEKRSEANSHALSVLVQHEKGVALNALRECEMASTEGFERLPGDVPVVSSIVALHPSEAVEISRNALSEYLTQAGAVNGARDFTIFDPLTFGFGILERHGNKLDCSLLRKFASEQKYGRCAIAALRAIEERSSKC